MLQALINLFKTTKPEPKAECPYKIETPVVETKPVVEEKPQAVAKPAKKPAVKAKTARNKKK